MGLFDFLLKENVSIGELQFTLKKTNKGKCYVLTSINGFNEEVLEIPNNIKKVLVEEIESGAIKDKPNLKTIRLPRNVTYLRDGFITNCPNVEKIEFPYGSEEFKTFDDGKILYGDKRILYVVPTFNGTLDLKDVSCDIQCTLGDGQKVDKIIFGEYSCFLNSRVAQEISKNQPNIVFEIPENNFEHYMKDGTIYNKRRTNRFELVNDNSIAEPTVYTPFDRKEPATTLTFRDVKELQVFEHFKALRVPDNILEIAPEAIKDINMEELIIPPTVKKISGHAICGCKYLKVIYLSNNTEIIDATTKGLYQAFYNLPSLEKFVLLDSKEKTPCYSIGKYGELIRYINNEVSYLYKFPTGLKLQEYRMPEKVKYIFESAFEGTQIENIDLGEDVCGIERFAFKESMIKKIIIPEKTYEIEQYAFYNLRNPIEELSLPADITIKEHAFEKCKLANNYFTYRGAIAWWKDEKKKISPLGNELLVGETANCVCMLKEVPINPNK